MPGIVTTSRVDALTAILGIGPKFTFRWQAEVVAEAPVQYAQARYFYEHNARRVELHMRAKKSARRVWLDRRPWYCLL